MPTAHAWGSYGKYVKFLRFPPLLLQLYPYPHPHPHPLILIRYPFTLTCTPLRLPISVYPHASTLTLPTFYTFCPSTLLPFSCTLLSSYPYPHRSRFLILSPLPFLSTWLRVPYHYTLTLLPYPSALTLVLLLFTITLSFPLIPSSLTVPFYRHPSILHVDLWVQRSNKKIKEQQHICHLGTPRADRGTAKHGNKNENRKTTTYTNHYKM